jgi:hypothetical protein
MGFLIAVIVALIAVPALKAGIGNIERELARKPVRYDDTD